MCALAYGKMKYRPMLVFDRLRRRRDHRKLCGRRRHRHRLYVHHQPRLSCNWGGCCLRCFFHRLGCGRRTWRRRCMLVYGKELRPRPVLLNSQSVYARKDVIGNKLTS